MSREFEAETWYQDSQVSIAFIRLKGVNDAVRNNRSTTCYEIVSGIGHFSIRDQRADQSAVGVDRDVYPGDKITIPRGAIYQDSGDLVMLATSWPPFDLAFVENPPVIEDFQAIMRG